MRGNYGGYLHLYRHKKNLFVRSKNSPNRDTPNNHVALNVGLNYVFATMNRLVSRAMYYVETSVDARSTILHPNTFYCSKSSNFLKIYIFFVMTINYFECRNQIHTIESVKKKNTMIVLFIINYYKPKLTF